MTDRTRGLPDFPSEESNRYERTLGPREQPRDRIVDRLRHAWPMYTILGLLLGSWMTALVVVALSSLGWEAFFSVLFFPAIPFLFAVRIWWWSLLYLPRRKDD